MQPEKHLVILTSGIGLGLYIPSLIMAGNLQKKGYSTEVHVFEDYITVENKSKIERSRMLFQKKFEAGILSQKILTDKQDITEQKKTAVLIDSWLKKRRKKFLVFSGSWVYLLNLYRREIIKEPLDARLLYLDYSMPLSWRSLSAYCPGYRQNYREIFLYDRTEGSVNFRITADSIAPVPFAARDNRCLIHGGGWNLGTYRTRTEELLKKNIPLNIILSHQEEYVNYPGNNRRFISDPAWSPFNQCEHTFPGIGEVLPSGKIYYQQKKRYHPLFDLICTSKAVISKGGGGTLVDSLSAATPAIFLEPYGPHEKENSQFWQQLQCGISYEEWKKANYSPAPLERMHENLLELRAKTPALESLY